MILEHFWWLWMMSEIFSCAHSLWRIGCLRLWKLWPMAGQLLRSFWQPWHTVCHCIVSLILATLIDFILSFSLLYHLFHLTAAGLPTNVHAMPAGILGFKVSWTAPTSGATVTGYRIYYSRGADEGSTDILAGDTSVTISNCTWSLTNSVRIVALSNHLPSPVVWASIATFGK